MSSDIKVRDYRSSDLHFIKSSWLKSYRALGYPTKNISGEVFWTYHSNVIDKILSNPMVRVLIACDSSDDEQILGYLIADCIRMPDKDNQDVVFHYVLTKREFQKMGIAKKMLDELGVKEGDRITYTHLSRLWTCDHRAPLPTASYGFCSYNYCSGDTAEQWIAKKHPTWVYNPYLI